jgi:hypothetical protein
MSPPPQHSWSPKDKRLDQVARCMLLPLVATSQFLLDRGVVDAGVDKVQAGMLLGCSSTQVQGYLCARVAPA